jgi:16S rRNA (guanine527-N7)-methyltransferase
LRQAEGEIFVRIFKKEDTRIMIRVSDSHANKNSSRPLAFYLRTRPIFLYSNAMTQAQMFSDFLNELEKWNKKLNLISYKTREELQIKHVQDSLALLEVFELGEEQKVLDLGCGGGFPGIPLAIMCPQAEFTLVDATAKKIDAIQAMVKKIGLKNVKTLCGRFETLAHDLDLRESFGLVVARAVAPLSTLLEYAAGFVCIHGLFVAYKSGDFAEELKASLKAQAELHLMFDGPICYELPEGQGSRSLLVFRKTEAISDAYPRKNGLPKKRPL